MYKDTRYTKRLSKGVEGGAPGDLPGSNVSYHKLHLQHHVIKLKKQTNIICNHLYSI